MPRELNKYFYLKIGSQNHLAVDWLAGRHEQADIVGPAAVVFFDGLSEAAYRKAIRAGQPAAGMSTQAFDFCRCGEPEFRADRRLVVICSGRVWILRPSGTVRIRKPTPELDEDSRNTCKLLPVESLTAEPIPLKDVPAVLAGISSDRFVGGGTFRPINHWGNWKAIDIAVWRHGGPEPDWSQRHWRPTRQGRRQLLECLSSTEIETLLARLLEERGCFVPARCGGTLKDIDLFAHNDGSSPVVLDGGKYGRMVIPAAVGDRAGTLSVQVKSWASGDNHSKSAAVDALVGLNVVGPGSFDARWLHAVILQSPATRRWLARSLNWLPRNILTRFGL
jgi:hypothetical protein